MLHTAAEGFSIALTKAHDSVVQGLTVSVRPSLKQTRGSVNWVAI